MLTLETVDVNAIAIELEKVRKYMLTVYLEVGKDIEETMGRLSKQINKLDIRMDDVKLDALHYHILQSVVRESGIAELRSRLHESRFSHILPLLDLEDCHNMGQYLGRIDEAVQVLKSA